ncbi:hypothetical protein [uncultured Sphingomonas sp.]|uniref:hypothetical protein n=1 Tax=uncultured Sphingomonas sp. TaxID=158754 RepID=UPI0025DC8FA7|nr:hypothetical protein [uncultured Sphingomonas sp.]
MDALKIIGADLAEANAAPLIAPAETLSHYRRKTIVALTAGMEREARTALVNAAFALRRATRGPSKLARRFRRKARLGLAGAF